MALDEAQLIQILKDPQKPLFAKAKACQRLAVTGTRQAVPALAALLADPQVAHYARFGLEPIPDPSVDAALRDALKKLKGKLQTGVIQSISNRRDAKAVKPVAQLLPLPVTEWRRRQPRRWGESPALTPPSNFRKIWCAESPK